MLITPIARLLVPWVALVLAGCECQSERELNPYVPIVPKRETSGVPVLHDGERLTPAERERVAELTALVTQYYPVWQPEHETMNDYFERYEDAPETQRLHALIRQRVEGNHTWPACLSEIQTALRGKLEVRNGTPPMFYIPSFQVVLRGPFRGGHLSMVFRISMLTPLYDYYQYIRDPTGRKSQLSLTPTHDTLPIARLVRGIIARYYPEYEELPPDLGTVRVPNMSIENLWVGEVSLADGLFEDDRRWW